MDGERQGELEQQKKMVTRWLCRSLCCLCASL